MYLFLFLLFLFFYLIFLNYLFLFRFSSIRSSHISVFSIPHYLIQQVTLDLLHRLHPRLRIQEYQVKYRNQARTPYITENQRTIASLIVLMLILQILFMTRVSIVKWRVRVQNRVGFGNVSSPLKVETLFYPVEFTSTTIVAF